jgi:hypothetical protein
MSLAYKPPATRARQPTQDVARHRAIGTIPISAQHTAASFNPASVRSRSPHRSPFQSCPRPHRTLKIQSAVRSDSIIALLQRSEEFCNTFKETSGSFDLSPTSAQSRTCGKYPSSVMTARTLTSAQPAFRQRLCARRHSSSCVCTCFLSTSLLGFVWSWNALSRISAGTTTLRVAPGPPLQPQETINTRSRRPTPATPISIVMLNATISAPDGSMEERIINVN